MPWVTLVYDSDCGPCTRFRRIVGFLDTRGRLNFASLTTADRTGLLDQVPAERRHRSFHLASRSGAVSSGTKALPELLALLPSGGLISGLVARAPLGYRSLTFVYTTFARLHDAGSCSYRTAGPVRKEFDQEYSSRSALPTGFLGA